VTDQQTKFEGWAVVELFGHQREIGFVTTQYYGSAAMFQLDVPEREAREWELDSPQAGTKVKKAAAAGRTRLINPSAVYALNPCTEEAAKRAIERNDGRTIQLASFPEGQQAEPALPTASDQDAIRDDVEAADRRVDERPASFSEGSGRHRRRLHGHHHPSLPCRQSRFCAARLSQYRIRRPALEDFMAERYIKTRDQQVHIKKTGSAGASNETGREGNAECHGSAKAAAAPSS
jgi:hypothetical protein